MLISYLTNCFNERIFFFHQNSYPYSALRNKGCPLVVEWFPSFPVSYVYTACLYAILQEQILRSHKRESTQTG